MKYTKNDIKEQLSALGIKPGDTVLIHTAYSKIGEVEGGPDAFIDAFCEYLEGGRFIVPTHTWGNVTPENPVYDVRATVPCIGLLPRIAARRSDGMRTLHPTHSVWIRAADKEELAASEENAETPHPWEVYGGSSVSLKQKYCSLEWASTEIPTSTQLTR